MKGRKEAKPAQAKEEVVDTAALAEGGRALAVIGNRLQVIEERFGLRPYDQLRVIDESRFFLSQSAGAMLELGKRLIQIKEAEPHGVWLECLSKIGIEPRIAQHVMRCALKFGGEAEAFAQLGRAKLYELAFLDDAEVAELAEGGTVAGLELDDIERMSVRELRGALREARAEKDAADQLLEKKNKKIDELDTKLNKRRHKLSAEGEARAAMVASVAEQTTLICQHVATLSALLDDADAQDMLMDVPTQEALFRSVHLAWLAFSKCYDAHGVCDVDDLNKQVFDK